MDTLRRRLRNGAGALATLCLLAAPAFAHPGSGIVIDRQGRIYFVDTGKGVWRIDPGGRLVRHDGPAFHWMAIDAEGRFAGARFPPFPSAEVTSVGADPTLILSSDFPLVVGRDGALYYPELRGDQRLQIIRLTPTLTRAVLATLPAATESGPLRWLNGMAVGPDGSIYYTEDRAVRKVSPQGSLSTVADKVTVPGCSRPPGETGDAGPDFRGLDVGRDGTVFVAASGCGALLRITPRGGITAVLRTASPWSPTAVAVSADGAYALEYLHTASENRREWLPRVRKVSSDGKVTLVAAVPPR